MPTNNKKEEKRFSDYIEEIQSDAKTLLDSGEVEVQAKAGEILRNANELASALRGMRNILIFSFVISFGSLILAFIFGVAYFESRVEGSIGNTEKKILYPNDESTLSYRERDGNIVTYMQFAKENDSLYTRANVLEDSLFHTKFKLDFAIETYGIRFSSKEKGDSTTWGMSSAVLDSCRSSLDDAKRINIETSKLIKESQTELKKKGY